VALADEVTDRVPEARLIQLTNPGTQSAAAIDTTILGLACTDVAADFEIYAGVEYDNSEARHVSVGIWGVLAKLALWSEAAGATANAIDDKWIEKLEGLAKVTGRDRIALSTSSLLTPTDEKPGTDDVAPWADYTHFDDLRPDAPD